MTLVVPVLRRIRLTHRFTTISNFTPPCNFKTILQATMNNLSPSKGHGSLQSEGMLMFFSSGAGPSRPKKGFRHRTHPINIADGDYNDYGDFSREFNDMDSFLNGGMNIEDNDGEEENVIDVDGFLMERRPDVIDLHGPKAQKRIKDEERILEEHLREEELLKERRQKAAGVQRERVIDEQGRAVGRGGRKTSRAIVWISPTAPMSAESSGDYSEGGSVTVNGRDVVDYFPRFSLREDLLAPMIVTRTLGNFDVQGIVRGGGVSGQAGAFRHGLARALEKYDPSYRKTIKAMGYLTRDSRMVERKKVGKVKARKAPQWVKR